MSWKLSFYFCPVRFFTHHFTLTNRLENHEAKSPPVVKENFHSDFSSALLNPCKSSRSNKALPWRTSNWIFLREITLNNIPFDISGTVKTFGTFHAIPTKGKGGTGCSMLGVPSTTTDEKASSKFFKFFFWRPPTFCLKNPSTINSKTSLSFRNSLWYLKCQTPT